jgi:S1-C subfamily serine protease
MIRVQVFLAIILASLGLALGIGAENRAAAKGRAGTFLITTSTNSLGSGWVLNPDGLAVTAAHVVGGAQTFQATFADGDVRDGVVVATDRATDLALLRIDPAPVLHPVPLAQTASMGTRVIAIGAPGGRLGTVTKGRILSIIARPTDQIRVGLIQHTAPLAQGSSGGPLLKGQGEVVGVNIGILTQDDRQGASPSPIGYAVPIDQVRRAILRMQASERRSPTPLPWAQREKSAQG